MATKTKSATNNKLTAKTAQISDDIHEMGDAARRIAGGSVDALRETAQDYYERGQSRAQSLYDQGQSRARNLGENMKSKVQDQPMKSLLIAAGIGFIAACLFRRK